MRSKLDNGITTSSTACDPSAEASENAPDAAGPCSAYNENSCFKENININKSETPKLSLEPRQRKRKKKGGGYNLRKSLAWDRAFSIEEGILDPLELSTISDVSCTERLPFTNGDDRGGSQQDEDLRKDRKKAWSSPKLDSSSSDLTTSTSLPSHKFSTRLSSKPGSRCGDCPRPLPSPSLKRPANVNVGKAAGKELKLLKLPGLNPGFTPTCATTRSTILRANRVKHNQIAQPDFSIQRPAEPKSSFRCLKKDQNASRANGLQSAHHSDRNLGNSSFRRHSSITTSAVMVDKANNSASKMISDNMTAISTNLSSEGQRYDSTPLETPFPQSAHTSCTAAHLQNIMAKPSGLRMPSPSLSFFSLPKPSGYRDLPLRNTETDVSGSHKPGSLRLQEKLSLPKMNSMILERTTSSSKAVSSRPECTASSHAGAIELIKLNSEQHPMHKIQDLPKKDIIVRISHEADLQKTGIKLPSKIESCEPIMDILLKKATDGYPVESESRGTGWRNAELRSEQSYAIQESETISAIDEPPKEKDTCNFLVSDHGSAQCTDVPDDGVQNTLVMQNGTCFSGSMKPLEQRQIKTEYPYFGSNHQCADLLKGSASVDVFSDSLLSGEAHVQSSVFALAIEAYQNDGNSMPQARDDTKLPPKVSKVKSICHEVEMQLEKIVKLDASERLFHQKNISSQNSRQEENVERLLSVVPDGNDVDEVIGNKMPISPSRGRRYNSILGKEKIIAEPLIGLEFDFADKSMSSESENSLSNTIFNCNDKNQASANVLLNRTAYEKLLLRLHQDTQRTEMSNCSPLPENRVRQSSQKDTPGKGTEEDPCIQGGSADNQLISSMSLQNSEPNFRGLQGTGTVLEQSPESDTFGGCCLRASEHMELASDKFVAEKCAHSIDSLQTERAADMYYEDNALGRMEDSFTGQDEMDLGTSKRSAKESILRHEIRNDDYKTGSCIADAITDTSRIEHNSDTITGEVSESTNISFSCDHVQVEAALASKNKHQNDLNWKCCSLVLPQNAIPFSDEWLAAIEAAGEEILTRKGGAVQNSPPDKSLPEPSPWSPVKRKNNQIGPFDCTKFTAPSDSG